MNGSARPLGAVLVGYQGVRTFTPSPVCRLVHCVTGGEGMRISLALIAMAQDVETLYASNKAACTLIKCNTAASIEMLRTSGYQVSIVAQFFSLMVGLIVLFHDYTIQLRKPNVTEILVLNYKYSLSYQYVQLFGFYDYSLFYRYMLFYCVVNVIYLLLESWTLFSV